MTGSPGHACTAYRGDKFKYQLKGKNDEKDLKRLFKALPTGLIAPKGQLPQKQAQYSYIARSYFTIASVQKAKQMQLPGISSREVNFIVQYLLLRDITKKRGKGKG